MKLTSEIMYQAILDKDTRFEGVFFTAVKTTGIFCRPSCNARKPKFENVEFLKTSKECITKGYRPCKVCKPLHMLDETPLEIVQLMDELSKDPTLRLKDRDLMGRGLEPHQVRRWFQKHHGITFHAYQRMLRISSAFKKIQGGSRVTETAFSSGFDSLSGFGETFKSILGVAPSASHTQGVIDLKRIETKLGTMYACAVESGVCLLEFSDRKMLETEFKALAKHFNAVIVQGSNKHFNELEGQLDEYFNGNRQSFSIPLVTPGTQFQNEVWEHLKVIPYGKTTSYHHQAIAIGKPKAVRAVARVNGMNRISILIPCHRVIGANGSLTGYGGGVWRKKYLLELEGYST